MGEPGISVDASELLSVLGEIRDIDLTPTMARAGAMLVDEVHQRWLSAGDGTWPRLAPSTMARRGLVAQILIDSGNAFGSVVPIFGKDYAEVGSDVDYLRYHCGDGPRTKIPERDPFDISDAAFDRIADFIELDVARRVDGERGGRR